MTPPSIFSIINTGLLVAIIGAFIKLIFYAGKVISRLEQTEKNHTDCKIEREKKEERLEERIDRVVEAKT